jgi:hypothetical protein
MFFSLVGKNSLDFFLIISAAALNPLPVPVLPEGKINSYVQELQRINISVFGFHWQDEKVVFSGLEKIKFT